MKKTEDVCDMFMNKTEDVCDMFMNKTEDEQNTEDGFSIEESKHEVKKLQT